MDNMTISNFDIKKANITEYLTLPQKRYLITKGMDSVLENVGGIFVCDGFAKDIFLTMVLLGTYFGCGLTKYEVGEDVVTAFNEEDYEVIHEKDLLGLIERTKHQKDKASGNSTDLARRVRRATDDFALFTKFFNTAVSNELLIRNDFAERLAERIALDLTPENWQKAIAEAKSMQAEHSEAASPSSATADETAG